MEAGGWKLLLAGKYLTIPFKCLEIVFRRLIKTDCISIFGLQ